MTSSFSSPRRATAPRLAAAPGLLPPRADLGPLSTGTARGASTGRCPQPRDVHVARMERVRLASRPTGERSGGHVTGWRREGSAPRPPTPEGRPARRAPPPLPDHGETGGVLAGAVSMLGSVGSIVVLATMAGSSSGGQLRS